MFSTDRRYTFLLIPWISFLIKGFWGDSLELITPDSQTYLDFHPSRTPGYPAFLWLVRCIGELWLVPWIHMICFSSACLYLGRSLTLFFSVYQRKQPLLVLLALGLICVHPEIMRCHWQIMTESLSLSLLLLILSIWIRFVIRFRWQEVAKLSLLIGLGILIRPVHYAWLSLFLLMAFSPFFRSWRMTFVSLVPLVMILTLGSGIQKSMNGFWGTQSFLGFNLIGKIAFIMKPHVEMIEPDKYAALYKSFESVQQIVKETKTLQQKLLLKWPYYDVMRYQILPTVFPEGREWDTTWAAMSLEIIKANPWGFGEDVLQNYVALWFFSTALNAQQQIHFHTFLEAHSPLPYMKSYPFTLRAYPKGFLSLVRLAFGSIFLASLCFFIGGTLGRSSLLRVGAGASILIHSQFLLTSLLQAGLMRYAAALWPAQVLLGTLILFILINRFR